jgi:hypothetical protein
MKILFSLLLIGLFAGNRCSSQGKDRNQSWIERLKITPVARMEAGLPEKPFDQWLTGRLKADPPKYQLGDCQGTGGGSAKCILVTAETAPGRKTELTFSIPAESSGTAGEAAVCSFMRGVIGPSDPRSKQSTRLIRKLSELEAMFQ